jgi:hypothetical protein
MFALLSSNMITTFNRWQDLQSTTGGPYTYEVDMAGYAIVLPLLWIYVLANCITQYENFPPFLFEQWS